LAFKNSTIDYKSSILLGIIAAKILITGSSNVGCRGIKRNGFSFKLIEIEGERGSSVGTTTVQFKDSLRKNSKVQATYLVV
jgi:hypothetical protein